MITMIRYALLALTLLSNSNSFSQRLQEHDTEIKAANERLRAPYENFIKCVASSHLDNCISDLLKTTKSGYERFVVGNILFDFDKKRSLDLVAEAYRGKPNELAFLREYALGLHRNGNYKDAAPLYERYLETQPADFRAHIWLADCYINIGDAAKAVDNWKLADHAKHHVAIDNAIYLIYGSAEQHRNRDNYRIQLGSGNVNALYPLVFQDMNWELDWWNKKENEDMLKADMALAKTTLGSASNVYKDMQAYITVKRLSEHDDKGDSIKLVLDHAKLVLDKYPIPANGQVASDLLRICLLNKLIDEKQVYAQRGQEILDLARKTKDKELLNIYAYLQSATQGKVTPEIDKMGWTDMHDERFAASYLYGKASTLRSDDAELAQAIADFPNSSIIMYLKISCVKKEGKNVKSMMPDLIRKEFRSLANDESHFSYALNSFFALLEEE